MKRVLIIFGTRPEVIKMAPVAHAIDASPHLLAITCATAQHRQLLDQPLEFFGIEPQFDLDLMKPNQDLFDVTASCLMGLREVYQKTKPDIVLVQGDTTTTFASALAAFYLKIPVGHVEAGLRTGDKYSPFPEEINRTLVTPLADLHFAPTQRSVDNLHRDHVNAENIFLTGNTSIDALLWGKARLKSPPDLAALHRGKKLVLMTAHRRENFGRPLHQIFVTIREFAQKHPEIQFIYPVHPNPNVLKPAHDILWGLANVSLIEPVNYDSLLYLMNECQFVVTDSGGLQEEAPTLGKPVVVLRESTERPEAVEAGCARLVGSNPSLLREHLEHLSDSNSELYRTMSQARNPLGEGTAAKQIAAILEARL